MASCASCRCEGRGAEKRRAWGGRRAGTHAASGCLWSARPRSPAGRLLSLHHPHRRPLVQQELVGGGDMGSAIRRRAGAQPVPQHFTEEQARCACHARSACCACCACCAAARHRSAGALDVPQGLGGPAGRPLHKLHPCVCSLPPSLPCRCGPRCCRWASACSTCTMLTSCTGGCGATGCMCMLACGRRLPRCRRRGR